MEHVKLNVQLALSPRVQIILRSTLTLVLIAALALLSVLQELSPRVNTGCTGDEFKTIYKKALSIPYRNSECLFVCIFILLC